MQRAHWLALILPAGLMAGALGSQFFGGLFPCEMCHWQRWPHYAAIAIVLLSFIVPAGRWRSVGVALAALAILASGVIGFYHAGVEYGWFQGLTRCANLGSGVSDLTSILKAPIISCDVPQWTLFGISLAGYNAIISILGSLTIFALMRRREA